MKLLLRWLGKLLARFLVKPTHIHSASAVVQTAQLLAILQPGDVLLVEGNSRVSTAIKYLTQSTWSHAALFVGSHLADINGNTQHFFVEADIVDGIRSVGIEEFAGLNVRICRPVGLSEQECRQVTRYAIAKIGNQYDLQNVFDLARYLLPTPPVPLQVRRKMLALGSGDPTKAICSTLVAQAFQSIHYPILPVTDTIHRDAPNCPDCMEEIHHIRHHSLFAPRDFDISPYFDVIKPQINNHFDYHKFHWDNSDAATQTTSESSQSMPHN